jgi:hypothetical protein
VGFIVFGVLDTDTFFSAARPGIITDVLVSRQAINVFEVERSSFAPHVKPEPLCESFCSVLL